MDGNRRWARASGFDDPSIGHRYGANHVEDLLGWCDAWGIDHLTAYVLSADNIRRRPREQVDQLFGLLTDTLPNLVIRSRRWALHVAGDLDLLPVSARAALAKAEEATADRPAHVTMAIGYDGRTDIVDAVRRGLLTHGPQLDEDVITANLAGGPVKEIDLVIRTSGELRLSGFFPWQSSKAEIVVSPKMWPAFEGSDFEAALRAYADRGSETP